MDKIRERAIVEAFIRWGGHPGLWLREWERERPDALIADGERVIGVEVTAVNEALRRQATAPQQWTTEAFRIVDAAKRTYEAGNGDPVVVRFEMRPDWRPPTRQRSHALAAELAALVTQVLASPPAWPLDREPYTLHEPHADLSRAYIGRSNFGNHWQPSIAGQVLAVSEADLQATVARKEPELPAYRQVASLVWLLIDCDVSGQGIALDIPRHQYRIVSAFDRVFCCGFGMWQWAEVSLAGPQFPTAG